MVQVLVQRLLTAMAYRQQRQKFQVRPKTAGADFQALHLVATKLQLKRNKNEIETARVSISETKIRQDESHIKRMCSAAGFCCRAVRIWHWCARALRPLHPLTPPADDPNMTR